MLAEGNPSQAEGNPSQAEGNPSQAEGNPNLAEGNPNSFPFLNRVFSMGYRRFGRAASCVLACNDAGPPWERRTSADLRSFAASLAPKPAGASAPSRRRLPTMTPSFRFDKKMSIAICERVTSWAAHPSPN
jgi:hypothetical protein